MVNSRICKEVTHLPIKMKINGSGPSRTCFLSGKLSGSQKTFVGSVSRFFVGLVTAAPNLPKFRHLLLDLKSISVYSVFGQVIEFLHKQSLCYSRNSLFPT